MNMKYMKKILFTAALLLLSAGAWAQTDQPVASASPADSTAAKTYAFQGGLLTSKIAAMARTYGDRVYLRWVPEDYVSYVFLTTYGVNVLRENAHTYELDTLAMMLKPWTEEQFRAKYQNTDESAMLCMGVLYGEGRLEYGQTKDKPGSMNARMDVNSEEDISFALAMLAADWRPDLAEAMAVGFVDRTAKRDSVYNYYIQPSQWEELGGKIIFEPGVVQKLANTSFTPAEYDPGLADSLVSPRRVNLYWMDDFHSSFEIERREVADTDGRKINGQWERINAKPYVTMIDQGVDGLNIYSDSVSHDGTWQYRIAAHDAFGTLTPTTPAITSYVRDIEPPVAPELKYILIGRPDDDPMARVIANVVWQNPERQFPDIAGYVVQYYQERETGFHWMPLTPLAPDAKPREGQLISPTDTIASFDVTNLSTGMIVVSAYDQSGNESQSMAQLIRLTDYKAPDAPDSLACTTVVMGDQGYALVSWQMTNSLDDDIDYYDVAFANDSTHTFLPSNQKGIRETNFIDTLALNVNQKYVYYKVRAVDYSGNIGNWSRVLQVKRPHNTPPTIPHLQDSRYDEKKGMHMEWVVGKDADMEYHLLQRRMAPIYGARAASPAKEEDWQTLARWDADSLTRIGNYSVTVDDNPAYSQEMRYYYRVVSYNSTSLNSSSLAVSWQHRGPRYYDIKISLAGDYFEKEEQVRLVWERGELPLEVQNADYYYCIFRKGQDDKSFRYMINVPSDKTEYTDRTLRKGEQADYYVTIRFRDGRESTVSNTVTVKREK